MNNLSDRLKTTFVLNFMLLASILTNAQPFVPDKTGYVADPKFVSFIQSRHYQLVGLFQQIDGAEISALVLKNGQWIRIDKNGRETTNASAHSTANGSYHEIKGDPGEIDDFDTRTYMHPSNINLEITTSPKCGLINKKTKAIIIPAKYDEIKLTDFGFVLVRNGAKWGTVSKKGTVLINPKYDEVQKLGGFMKGERHITGDAVIVASDKKWGLISADGSESIKPQYNEITSSLSGFSILFIRIGNKWGLINNKGSELIKPIYAEIEDFSKDGLATTHVMDDQSIKKGIIDTMGREIIKPIYDVAYSISNKLIVTQIGKNREIPKVNIWSNKGEKISEHVYKYVGRFFKNLAIVISQDSKEGCIDSTGHEVLKPTYDVVTIPSDQFFIVSLNKQHGVVARNGNIIIPLKYENVWYDDKIGLFHVTSNSKAVMIDFYKNQY